MRGEAAFWQVVLRQKGPRTPEALAEGYAMAAAEGLAGLYYRRTLDEGGLPDALAAHAAAAYRQTAGRNLLSQVWLGRLLEAGADFVLLPGGGLMSYYPDLGCRWMEDMDLLVRPADRRRLEGALRAVGAAPLARHPDLWSVEGPAGAALFDLHADLVNSERVRTRRWAGWVDPDKAWDDRREYAWDGLRLQALCPEDALLYSAAHAVRHGFRRLAWIIDIGLLLPRADWKELRQRAEDARLEGPLRYCCEIWRRNGGPLGPEAAGWLEAAAWRRAEKAFFARALAERGAPLWGDALLAANIRGRLRRWVFWGETCFPRPAVLLQVYPALPPRLAVLGYFLRAGWLVWAAAKLAARLGKRLLAAKRGAYVS